jgi:transcriptional regulator with XRE-family HTH domain
MKDKAHDLPPISQAQWQHFGALLRDRRNAAKLSRLALAHRAKVSDATIKFIETARHPPSRSTLIRLLSVAELHLTWADVPGSQEPPAEKPDLPALSLQNTPDEPKPDPAQFLMNLIGFDELRLPPGAPKKLRIFQERPRDPDQASGDIPKDERGGK